MGYKLIDAHTHLWLKQDAEIDGQVIRTTKQGRSLFMGEERQMLPPFMIDGRNTAEVFLSNMDYAQVSAAVVVQEFIDGIQNDYLLQVKRAFPDRFKVCGMTDFRHPGFLKDSLELIADDFDGLAIPGHRLPPQMDLSCPEMMVVMHALERSNKFLSLCLDPDRPEQISQVEQIIAECPNLRIAIGHFGMVTTPNWLSQIKLARHKNVMVESGGITWLFNSEFYPYPSAIQAIRQAADLVGFDKLMWGSDYPRTITAITYRMSYDFIVKSAELSDQEKAKILGLNAQHFYGFDELVELPYIKNMSE